MQREGSLLESLTVTLTIGATWVLSEMQNLRPASDQLGLNLHFNKSQRDAYAC